MSKGINTKKQLAIALSQLKGFERPDFRREQYVTESDFAAEIAWYAFYRGEIQEEIIADLGCGTGILGISTLILGAKKVFFVDIDEKAVETAKENIKFLEEKFRIDLMNRAEFRVCDVSLFDDKVDLIIQNPPFGIKKEKHKDREFLKKAISLAPLIYSFHMADSTKFISSFSKDNQFKVEGRWEFDWPLKQTMSYHKKKIQYIKVACFRLEKIE